MFRFARTNKEQAMRKYVDAFNERIPVGTKVIVLDAANHEELQTVEKPAYVDDRGMAVVKVTVLGVVPLSRVLQARRALL